MSSLVIVGLVATFVGVLVAALAIGSHSADRRRALALLHATAGVATPADLREQSLSGSFSARALTPLVRHLKPVAARFTPADARERLQQKLVRAGTPAGWDVEKLLVARALSTVLLPVLAFLALAGYAGSLRLVATGVALYAGYFGPIILLDARIEKRQTAIRKALPDTIDLLTISVEAGLGFDAALTQVVNTVPGPLSQEIARTLREMQLGVSRADAFRNLKDRADIEELRGFTLAIIQADSLGISIGNVLRAQSDTLRMKRKQRTEELAMKIPVKILFPVILCVLPSLFIVVLGPGIIRMMESLFA